MKKDILVSLLGIGILPFASAQTPAPPTPAGDLPKLWVDITQVSESRMLNSSSVILNLTIAGEETAPLAVVRQFSVTRAVDNQGRTLSSSGNRVILAGATFTTVVGVISGPVLATASTFASITANSPMAALGQGGISRVPYETTVSLSPVARDATSIKQVEGTVELYQPSESNNAILRIPNIRSHPGRIEHPLLVKHGIVLFYLGDKESYDDAARRASGTGRLSLSDPVTIFTPDWVKSFTLSSQDNSRMILGIELQDAGGVPIPTQARTIGSTVTNYLAESPLPDDAQLVIYLATPEAIKTVPFRFENVPLL